MSVMVGTGPRRAGGRARAQRGGPRAAGGGRRPGRGQDGHAHRGPARRWPRSRPWARSTSRRCCAWRPASSRAASIRWPPRSSAAPASARHRPRRAVRLRVAHRPRGDGHRGRRAGRRRQPAAPRGARHRRGRPRGPRGRRSAQQGQTVMFVAVDGAPGGAPRRRRPHQARRPRRRSPRCARKGLRVVMVTGDNAVTARAVAAQLGIEDVVADVLPEQKVDVVREVPGRGPRGRHGRRRHQRRARAGPGRRRASRWGPAPTWPWRARR